MSDPNYAPPDEPSYQDDPVFRSVVTALMAALQLSTSSRDVIRALVVAANTLASNGGPIDPALLGPLLLPAVPHGQPRELPSVLPDVTTCMRGMIYASMAITAGTTMYYALQGPIPDTVSAITDSLVSSAMAAEHVIPNAIGNVAYAALGAARMATSAVAHVTPHFPAYARVPDLSLPDVTGYGHTANMIASATATLVARSANRALGPYSRGSVIAMRELTRATNNAYTAGIRATVSQQNRSICSKLFHYLHRKQVNNQTE
jgi:hypothetical protein